MSKPGVILQDDAAVASKAGYTATSRWAVVVLLALASVVAYIDRMNLSIAVIDNDFKSFFHLSKTDRGLANSAFFWSYAILQIPAGWIVDRYGSKRPVAISFAIWSLLTATTALTTGFASLFAVRLLLGLGEAVMHPGCLRWIRFNFDERRRGLAVGIFVSGSKFGPAIGAVLAAWLIEAHGWRAMFVVLGLAALVWLIPWLLLVRDDHATSAAPEPRVYPTDDEVPMRRLLASPALWGTMLGTFSYMYVVYFSMTWLPSYLSEARGLSLASSSLYTTFSFAGMAVVAVLGGWAADWLIGRGADPVTVRRRFTIIGFALASTEMIGVHTASLDGALAISVLSLSGLGLATANYWALTQTLIPGKAIGRIIGIQNAAASFAGIVAPILTGGLVDRTGSYAAPLNAVAAFAIIGIASYLFLVTRRFAPTSAVPGKP